MARAKRKSDGYYRHREKYKGIQIDIRALTEPDLNAKVDAKRAEIDGRTPTGSTTVAEWCATWLAEYKKPFVIAEALKNTRSLIDCHVIPHIGKLQIRDVRHIDLQRIMTSLAGCSASHISQARTTLRAIFRQAKINELIDRDPSEGLISPAGTYTGHRVLTDEETRLLLEVCACHRYGLYGLLMYYCGLRPQEAAALLWSDIDFDTARLSVNKAVEAGRSGNIKSTKTRAGVRALPIPEPLLDRLAAERGEPDQLVLPYHRDRRPGTIDIRDGWWRAILREMNIRAGAKVYRQQLIDPPITDLTAYDLRHTYCTNLQRAGVPLNVAKYLMGHSDVSTTANIYTHNTDDQTDTAAADIDRFFAGSGDKNGE